MQITKEYLKHTFTDEESLGLSRRMAQEIQKLNQAQATKKEVVSDLAAQIAKHNSEIGRLSDLINNGYEYQYIDCDVLMNEPEQGKKTIRRRDNGEIVKVVEMETFERQESLPFDQEAAGVVSSEAAESEKEPTGDEPPLASARQVEIAENGGEPPKKPKAARPN